VGRLTDGDRRLLGLPAQGELAVDDAGDDGCAICGRSLAGQRLGRWGGGLCDGCRNKRDRAKRHDAAWDKRGG
jgi:hypothetical protein